MTVVESDPAGFVGAGPRHVCRTPGCISNSLDSGTSSWIGAPRQGGSAPEVLGNSRSEPSYSPPPATTWLGSPPAGAEPPRRSTARERSTATPAPSTGHEFEDGICLHCGRVERLAGRYGWSCPVRLP